jgi:hypothetical protein
MAPLVVDQEGVVDADRLGDGKLNAGNEILKHRLKRKTDDQAHGAGRSEQADTILSHVIEGHQRRAERQNDDQGSRDALQDARLRHMLARQQIVFDIELIAAKMQNEPDMKGNNQRPSRQDDDADNHRLPHRGRLGLGKRRYGHGERDGEHDCGEPRRAFGPRDERPPEEIPSAADAGNHAKNEGMQPPGQENEDGDEDSAGRPIRDPGELEMRGGQKFDNALHAGSCG